VGLHDLHVLVGVGLRVQVRGEMAERGGGREMELCGIWVVNGLFILIKLEMRNEKILSLKR